MLQCTNFESELPEPGIRPMTRPSPRLKPPLIGINGTTASTVIMAAKSGPWAAASTGEPAMSVRNLEALFRPTSVAVIGASERVNSVGAVVMRNLLAGSFAGPIMPVNPRHQAVHGVFTYPDVASLPVTPDLAVICTPPQTVPGLIADLGKRGTRAAIVLTAGLGRERMPDGRSIDQAMLEAARPHLLRILGPNCIGLLVPGMGLNASFAHRDAAPGRIAFVSQSGALCTAALDWAGSAGIGFSHFISLGESSDVDFGDVLDYLGSDAGTRAILLYVESVKHRRKFMSAARAAARNKPVLAVKSGRVREAEQAAMSHTGAMAGGDDIYTAAFRRAGIVRVDDIDELFEAVETLGRSRRLPGERLAILTNGGGPGVMAVDTLIRRGGRLAKLAPATIEGLNGILPATWSGANPVDIIGDATGERYAAALKVLLADPGIDAALVMYAPTATVAPMDAARALIEAAKGTQKNLLACWLGRDGVAEARRLFAEAGIPSYETPGGAIGAFMHMVEYRRTQEMLLETPPAQPEEFTPDAEAARAVIARALAAGRDLLTEPEAKAVLEAYRIPVVRTVIAADVEEAVSRAGELGFPVAIKILSPEISHKTDVGGVVLDLEGPRAVRRAAEAMLARVARLRPDARIEGFTVQQMARRPRARELIVGATTDPIFGPVLMFGEGGIAVELIADRAVALPPLNMGLAAHLIAGTRISRLLDGYRDVPAADRAAIALTLVKVSQLVVDLPEVAELDINPLFADAKGVIALDARIRVHVAGGQEAARLAISPYPQQLVEEVSLLGGEKVTLRPIRPEDEPQHVEFFEQLTPDDIRFRFFGLVRGLPHSEMARFTQIDYDREMAFIVTRRRPDGKPETLGVMRTATDPDNQKAEFAIIVRSDLKGQGIGRTLMRRMIDYTRSRGTKVLVGQILPENRAMRKMAEAFGFHLESRVSDGYVEVSLPLGPETARP